MRKLVIQDGVIPCSRVTVIVVNVPCFWLTVGTKPTGDCLLRPVATLVISGKEEFIAYNRPAQRAAKNWLRFRGLLRLEK